MLHVLVLQLMLRLVSPLIACAALQGMSRPAVRPVVRPSGCARAQGLRLPECLSRLPEQGA